MTAPTRTGRVRLAALALLLPALVPACSDQATRATRPNVLWIVWDTVRADRLSLYGYAKPTTPFLERWAREALVFEDCVSTAGSTVPSHASMFTGLLPSEHGTYHTNRTLDRSYTTIAELFQDAGYETYLFAANPHIQQKMNFDQGFERHEHPWSEPWRDRAIQIVRAKIAPEDSSTHLPAKMRGDETAIGEWALMASGSLAHEALRGWLERQRDASRPYFAFLNYMEAHNPYIPPRELRRRMMDPSQLERSYRVDNRGVTRWNFCFGLHEYPPGDLEVIGATYDAALLELDGLLRNLIEDLGQRGLLDDTIVVLTSDHGEQLGEHHMLDHQFALYDEMLRVPLVIHAPGRVTPGRTSAPVSNMDLFPTLLGLAGIAAPDGLESQSVSLLAPQAERRRLAEYPVPFSRGIEKGRLMHPDWDPKPWLRRLRALYDDQHKLICGSDGRHELYQRAEDPGESRDLARVERERVEQMMNGLLDLVSQLQPVAGAAEAPEYSEQEKRMLIALGYLTEDDVGGEEAAAGVPDWGACAP